MEMRYLYDKKGVALVMVLMIIAISTAMIAAVLFFIQRGTEISALEKKYATAKEASLGAVEIFTKEIIPLAIVTASTTPSNSLTTALTNFPATTSASVTAVATNSCFSDKLLKSTASWATGCSNSSDPKTLPDIKLTLSGVSPAQPFDVYVKIVDTVSGNTNTSGVVLEGAGAAETGGGMIFMQHFPYMYRTEIQGEKQKNPNERANFELLYAY
jgi:hypothetical protein